MVEFVDGAVIAQLSMPDMRLPIAYALEHPQRAGVPYGGIDWSMLSRLDFAEPDRATFRCLDLAYAAGRTGGTAPAWLSAANEVAVEAFLAGRLTWTQIPEIIDATLQHHDGVSPRAVGDILEADASARRIAQGVLQ
jgi:1-deoxy-D-xylulose-5-phosphate reductoisomerase